MLVNDTVWYLGRSADHKDSFPKSGTVLSVSKDLKTVTVKIEKMPHKKQFDMEDLSYSESEVWTKLLDLRKRQLMDFAQKASNCEMDIIKIEAVLNGASVGV
jgi:hypothetical protein